MAEIILHASEIPDDLAEYFEPVSEGNMTSVLKISTESYAGAHFATFPRKLVEPCIKAGTSEKGCCPECGAPWERVTEKGKPSTTNWGVHRGSADYSVGPMNRTGHSQREDGTQIFTTPRLTIGWRQTCTCPAHTPKPCTVLDPFIGSGTTIVVANALGRHGIGVDLSSDYLAQAKRRIERPHQPLTKQREQDHPLFAHMEDAP